jgi:uncharacterized LabA/DUF88 family protein
MAENNYAFIDNQNLNLGIRNLGWKLDWVKLFVYLKEKYQVKVAYMFLGFIPANQALYSDLQKAGFTLVFKPVVPDGEGKPKGNIDANLVLQAMADIDKYDQAVIISSDGDFYCLVDYLLVRSKLKKVLSPYKETCSVLLKSSAKDKIVFMDNLKDKLEYKRKSTA